MSRIHIVAPPSRDPVGVVRRVLARWARERTLLTLLIAAAGAMAIGQWTPRYDRGQPEGRFWASKLLWRDRAELVVAGDARVVYGVSPAEMAKALDGERAVNFGFHGLGYSRGYLNQLDKVLAESNSATVALGVTPMSLTDRHALRNRYTQWRRKRAPSLARLSPLARLRRVVKPISPEVLLGWVQGRAPHSQPRFFLDRRPSGWIGLGHTTGIERFNFADYRAFLAEGVRVNPRRVELLLDRVRRWRAEGVRVVGFRPPIPEGMRELERGFGLDYERFVERFTAAGGQWIPTPHDRFESLDGSHLPADQARAFSRYLGRRIARPGGGDGGDPLRRTP